MGRRYAKKTGQRPQDERDLSIRADFNDPPDLDKLCALDTLSAADADAFGADPDCGAIAALAAAADADHHRARPAAGVGL